MYSSSKRKKIKINENSINARVGAALYFEQENTGYIVEIQSDNILTLTFFGSFSEMELIGVLKEEFPLSGALEYSYLGEMKESIIYIYCSPDTCWFYYVDTKYFTLSVGFITSFSLSDLGLGAVTVEDSSVSSQDNLMYMKITSAAGEHLLRFLIDVKGSVSCEFVSIPSDNYDILSDKELYMLDKEENTLELVSRRGLYASLEFDLKIFGVTGTIKYARTMKERLIIVSDEGNTPGMVTVIIFDISLSDTGVKLDSILRLWTDVKEGQDYEIYQTSVYNKNALVSQEVGYLVLTKEGRN